MTDAHGTTGEDWAEARGALWLAELDLYEQMLEPLGVALERDAKKWAPVFRQKSRVNKHS